MTRFDKAFGEGGRELADDREHRKLSRGIKRAVDGTKARVRNLANNAEWIFGRRAARVLGVLALFGAMVTLLLVFLNWYVAPTKPSEKKDLVLALGQILAGTALLSGLYFTWRTLQVNREGQITERFTRAIDQLGATHDDNSKNLELRLGGIYALERISRESEEDHWSIMEVLTAYVRQHAPWRPPDEAEWRQEGTEDAAAEKQAEEDLRKKFEFHPLDPDIQAILTVLRRRTRSFGHGEPDPLDLHETKLTGANLPGADLTGADLSEADLSGAILKEAVLSGANLSLRMTDRVWGAILSNADLSGADLSGALLWRAVLVRANLREANLSEAVLFEAGLISVDLSGADLSGANLREANLSGANLSGAKHLAQAQLEETTGDENTRLPSDLKPPAHWSV